MKITHVEDYYDKIKEKFPDLEISEIDKILKHGFRSFFTLQNMGADVIVTSWKYNLVLYFGKLFFNDEVRRRYYIKKMLKKLHINYYGQKTPYCGYYFFGINDEMYDQLKNGETLKQVRCYKIKEEALLAKKYKYFFQVKTEEAPKYYKYLDIKLSDIELFATRDNENKLQYINGKTSSI